MQKKRERVIRVGLKSALSVLMAMLLMVTNLAGVTMANEAPVEVAEEAEAPAENASAADTAEDAEAAAAAIAEEIAAEIEEEQAAGEVFEEPVVYDEETEIVLGKAITVREGTDHTVIACGIMVNEAIQAAEKLAEDGISVRVLDMHTIKPLDEEAILKAAAETKSIITAEEHSVIGGLGAAVASVVSSKCPARVTMVGVQDRFGQSGKPEELKKEYGLTADDIVKAVKEADAE